MIVKLKDEGPEESVGRSRWRDEFREELSAQMGVPENRIAIETQGPIRVLIRKDRRLESRLVERRFGMVCPDWRVHFDRTVTEIIRGADA